jgi:hypothetical protein
MRFFDWLGGKSPRDYSWEDFTDPNDCHLAAEVRRVLHPEAYDIIPIPRFPPSGGSAAGASAKVPGGVDVRTSHNVNVARKA